MPKSKLKLKTSAKSPRASLSPSGTRKSKCTAKSKDYGQNIRQKPYKGRNYTIQLKTWKERSESIAEWDQWTTMKSRWVALTPSQLLTNLRWKYVSKRTSKCSNRIRYRHQTLALKVEHIKRRSSYMTLVLDQWLNKRRFSKTPKCWFRAELTDLMFAYLHMVRLDLVRPIL